MENDLEKIYEASLKFLEPLSLQETYKLIVDEAVKLVNAEKGSILLDENGELVRVYASDPALLKLKIRKRGYTYDVYKKRIPKVLDVDSVYKINPQIEKGVKSIILIPLAYRKESMGVLTVQSLKEKKFSSKELNILKLYGSMASMVIRKMQYYTETKHALETRDMFISLASHELRTPLTSINGYIQLLYSKLSKQDSSEGRWVRELNDESKRLTNLVTELLEINRIKQGQLHFNLRECHLGEVVSKSIERIKFTQEAKEIIFTNKLSDKKDTIIGDPEKLMQMITAVLSNANKFSFPNTIVTVTLSSQKSMLIIAIKDKGIGIKESDLPHVFEEFYKGSNINEKQGMGVGLIMAKHIVNFHKGTISIDSEVGKGTSITITFPKIKKTYER